MGYDRGDSFSFDFEPNGISFDSKSKGKLSPRSYPIQFERKWKHSFLSVPTQEKQNRTAVRETSSASLGFNCRSLKHHSTVVVRGLREDLSIGPVSRTAVEFPA